MLWGERVTRRRALVGILVMFALVDAALALAVVRTGSGAVPRMPLPLHSVAGGFVPDDTQLQGCSDEQCFEQALGNIAYRDGPKAAFALIGTVYGDGGGTSCHRAAHAVGAASLARYRGNVERTLAEGSSDCGSGYYHGVVERSLVGIKKRTRDTLGRAARTLCDEALSRATPWVANNCLHGVGHGLMIATGLSLPLSLAVCNRLATWWESDACKGGVFMENLQSSYGFQSRWLRDDDPVYPCNVVASENKKRCYQMVTSRILPLVGDDWERTGEVCSRVEPDFVSWCFWSFGRDASSRSSRNPAETARTCTIAKRFGGEGECLVGAAMDAVQNFASGPRAKLLCDAVRSELRADCFYGIGTVLGRFRKTEEARERDCRALVATYPLLDACVRGGRSTAPRG